MTLNLAPEGVNVKFMLFDCDVNHAYWRAASGSGMILRLARRFSPANRAGYAVASAPLGVIYGFFQLGATNPGSPLCARFPGGRGA